MLCQLSIHISIYLLSSNYRSIYVCLFTYLFFYSPIIYLTFSEDSIIMTFYWSPFTLNMFMILVSFLNFLKPHSNPSTHLHPSFCLTSSKFVNPSNTPLQPLNSPPSIIRWPLNPFCLIPSKFFNPSNNSSPWGSGLTRPVKRTVGIFM